MAHAGIRCSRPAAAGLASLLLICGTDSLAAAKAATYTVDISQMRYGPVPGNLKVGDTIVWVNKDSVPHTVTSKNRAFDVRIGAGKRSSQKLTRAGTLPFYCAYHPAMRGTLKVGGS